MVVRSVIYRVDTRGVYIFFYKQLSSYRFQTGQYTYLIPHAVVTRQILCTPSHSHSNRQCGISTTYILPTGDDSASWK